jgi:ribosomal subunit interface protein
MIKIDAIKATHIELTDAIRTAVEDELAALEPMAERYGDAVSVHVEVGKTTQHHHKGEVFLAEFNLKIPGKLLRAEVVEEDLYAAIHAAGNDLHRQLKDDKERHG